jgi:hypothetical protein
MSETFDRGAFIQSGYTVEPGQGGSFVVAQGGISWRSDGRVSSMRGFSNWRDLVAWLTEEHESNAPENNSANNQKEQG